METDGKHNNSLSSLRWIYNCGAYNPPKVRFYAIYGIFRQNLRTGLIEGYIQTQSDSLLSFGWRVAFCRGWLKTSVSGVFKSIKKESGYKYFIYRLTRLTRNGKYGKHLQIKAHFDVKKEIAIKNGNKLNSFDIRNIPISHY